MIRLEIKSSNYIRKISATSFDIGDRNGTPFDDL
jgi:hypothetical protein